MSGGGGPSIDPVDASTLHVGVAVTRWHQQVSAGLLAGALAALADCKVEQPTVVHVAGAFELPVIAHALAATHDAVVTLGVVIRGGTPHFDYVCRAVTDGCTRVALDTGVPVGFGVLTCDNEDQAIDRAGLPGSREDKGREAVLAAVTTALSLREIGSRKGHTPAG
ncbi:MAG: 6,7-dimethyl-8-ribityllumazine synthase [Frankiales bacterium]|jgi:6,7-dimethyl-8-ribityllumazine synthase|nr:6,7-dimethyl-8-ribityllumazine synthase [Frankiales bacterium]